MNQNQIFTVGEYEIKDRAEFAKVIGQDYVNNLIGNMKGGGKKQQSATAATTNIPGVRKAHTRTVKGKVQLVGQSVIKAGKRTAGALKAGGGRALGAGKKYGSQALGAGKKYGSRGVSLIKSNPKTSAAAAGITVLAAGTGYFAGRKKRKRR